MANPFVDLMKNIINIDGDHARIKIGKFDIAYHCDKFATRITKGLEDMMGVEKARDLIMESATKSAIESFATGIGTLPEFKALPVSAKLETSLEIYKAFGYGAVRLDKYDGSSTKCYTKFSYAAEGYLENMDRWQWKLRKEPFCHEMCGNLRAAFIVATGKSLEEVSVKEIQCRTMGNDECIFEVEVK